MDQKFLHLCVVYLLRQWFGSGSLLRVNQLATSHFAEPSIPAPELKKRVCKVHLVVASHQSGGLHVQCLLICFFVFDGGQ